jgi:hypothetical protein
MTGRPTNYVRNVVACKLLGLVESNPEFILDLAIFDELKILYRGWRCWVYSESEFRAFASSLTLTQQKTDRTFALVPQLNIADVGRVDLAIFTPQISVEHPLIVVECDGHQFHERTPEQASKDRKRIRALQRLGVTALPFTGTDVVRDSIEAAFEAAQIIDGKFNEKRMQECVMFEHSCQAREIEELRHQVDDAHTDCQWSALLGVPVR